MCGDNYIDSSNNGIVKNSYYLDTCAAEGTTFTNDDGISKTADQFTNGEVAYLLNFHQTIGEDEIPTLNEQARAVVRLTLTYDETFGDDADTKELYYNAADEVMLEKSTDKAYTYRYFDGETELTEDIYLMTGDAVLTVKKEAVKITVPADVDKLELTYKKAMTEVDLNSYVENAADLGKLTFKVDDASQLPEGLELSADGTLSGTPAKAADSVKTTVIVTAKNGETAKIKLTFQIAKADPTVKVTVDGDSHTEGDLVSELKLILSGNNTKGLAEIISEIKALTAGENTLTWKFTPEDGENYNVVTGTVVINAQTTTTTTTTTTTMTTTNETTSTTKETTATTKATTATSGTTSAAKATTATSGTTATTKATATTNETTATIEETTTKNETTATTEETTATSETTVTTEETTTTNETTVTTEETTTNEATATTEGTATTNGTTATTEETTTTSETSATTGETTTNETTATTEASTATTSETSATTATSGTTSATKATTATSGTTATTATSGTTSATKATTATSGTTSTTKESTTASETTTITSASSTESTAATSATTITTAATTSVTNIADDDLCSWAINDYQKKAGIVPANAEITARSEEACEITLTDENGNVLDVYTVDPKTGVGTDSSNAEINLPQTGNNSMTNWLLCVGAAMFMAFGFGAVKASGIRKRKEDE